PIYARGVLLDGNVTDLELQKELISLMLGKHRNVVIDSEEKGIKEIEKIKEIKEIEKIEETEELNNSADAALVFSSGKITDEKLKQKLIDLIDNSHDAALVLSSGQIMSKYLQNSLINKIGTPI